MTKWLMALFVVGVVLGSAAVTVAMENPEAQPMGGKHILAIKGEAAYYCTCGADCKCTLEGEEMTTCRCGKPVEKVNIQGKYACEHCCVIADKPGMCEKCGMELKEVK